MIVMPESNYKPTRGFKHKNRRGRDRVHQFEKRINQRSLHERIKDVGTTKVDVPAEAKQKLS